MSTHLNDAGRKAVAAVCCWGLLSAPGGFTGQARAAGLDMSAEEMLFADIPVVTVSRHAESIAKAPGVVSVLTAQDIKDLGAQTLAQAIGFMPGVQAYDSHWTQFNQFAIRGNLAGEHYNSKILFLVNGHPTSFALTGGFEVNSVPLDAVDRVELVRGPVSVQYGTNALTGVINIVTKKKVEGGNVEASYQYGSFVTHEARVSASKSSDDTRVFFSGDVRNQKGYSLDIRANQTENNTKFSRLFGKDDSSSFLNLQHGNLEMDVTYWQGNFTPKYGLTPSNTFVIPDFFQEHSGLDLRYQQKLGDRATIHYIGRFDYSHYDYTRLNGSLVTGPFFFTVGDRRAGGEVFGDLQPTDNLSVVTGVAYDNYFDVNWDEPNLPRAGVANGKELGERNRHSSDLGAYLNADYRLFKPVSLVGGARYSNNELTGSNWSGRAGSVVDLGAATTFKVLYGTSYRSPSVFEERLVSTTIIGSTKLKPETLKGVDLSLSRNIGTSGLASLTYFTDKTENFVTRTVGLTPNVYINVKGQKTQGLEYELKYRVFSPLTVWVNGSHLFVHKDVQTHQDTLVIEDMINFGGAWQATDKLRLTTAAAYHSGWRNILVNATGVPTGVVADAHPYTVANVSVSFKPAGPQGRLELFANGDNVFNKSSEYAEFARRREGTIPGGPPLSLMGGVKVTF